LRRYLRKEVRLGWICPADYPFLFITVPITVLYKTAGARNEFEQAGCFHSSGLGSEPRRKIPHFTTALYNIHKIEDSYTALTHE
jgi:hypothetical protein